MPPVDDGNNKCCDGTAVRSDPTGFFKDRKPGGSRPSDSVVQSQIYKIEKKKDAVVESGAEVSARHPPVLHACPGAGANTLHNEQIAPSCCSHRDANKGN